MGSKISCLFRSPSPSTAVPAAPPSPTTTVPEAHRSPSPTVAADLCPFVVQQLFLCSLGFGSVVVEHQAPPSTIVLRAPAAVAHVNVIIEALDADDGLQFLDNEGIVADLNPEVPDGQELLDDEGMEGMVAVENLEEQDEWVLIEDDDFWSV